MKAPENRSSDRPIRLLLQGQQVGLSNQIAPSGPTSRFVQSDRSVRTNKLDQPFRVFYTDLLPYKPIRAFYTDLLYVQTNQIYPTDLLSVRTNQISPTDLLPYQPIRSLLWTYIRTSQSDRSDGPNFRTSQSDRSEGPTFRTSQSDRSERHRPESHQEIKSLAWSQTAQVT